MTETNKAVAWGSICAEVRHSFPALGPVLDALDRFGDHEVHRLSLRYGTQLIKDGKFDWSLLGSGASRRLGYTEQPVPLALVTSKVVELYEPAPKPQTHRMIPQYLIQAGEFFGLFETVVGAEAQDKVHGSAGAATLYVLPPIGNSEEVANFGNQVSWTCPSKTLKQVKQWDTAELAFGTFFSAALVAAGSRWRAEIILFPKPFLDAMLANLEARIALLELTLSQMTVSRDRSQSTTAMLLRQERGVPGDLFAARQIASSIRPGFAPVFGTAADELLLPASELLPLVYHSQHGLFSNWDHGGPSSDGAARGADYFPALFRPSLPHETAYYFLKRPYGPSVDGANAKFRLTNLVADLESDETAEFAEMSPERLEVEMRAEYAAAGSPHGRRVHVGRCLFVDAGAVQIVKHSPRTGS